MNIEEKKRPHTEVAKKDENLHLLMIIFLIYYLGFCFTIDLYVHICWADEPSSLSVTMEGWKKMFMIIFAISRYVFCDFICYDVICNTIWWKEKKN